MFLINFIRFWKGSVRFQVTGEFAERFLNLSSRKNIPVWDIKQNHNGFMGTTTARSYKHFRPIARKTHVKIKIIEKQGAPFYKIRYRHRFGIGIGIILILFSMTLFSQFVWRIEVHGNSTVPTVKILEAAQERGLRKGALKKDLDVIRIGDELSVEFEEISWAAVNLIGTVAHVEIIERVMPPEVIDSNSPCNVIADRDGQIISINVYEGEKEVHIGDGVKKGDLLASGIIEDKKGKTYYKHARADVIAEFSVTKEFSIPLEQQAAVPGQNFRNYYHWNIGPLSIPFPLEPIPARLHGSNSSQKEILSKQIENRKEKQIWFYWEKEHPCSILGIALPWSITISQWRPAHIQNFTLSPEQAKYQALQKAAVFERYLQRENNDIMHHIFHGNIKNNCFVLTSSYLCRKEIGREEPIIMEDLS